MQIKVENINCYMQCNNILKTNPVTLKSETFPQNESQVT